MNRLTVLVCACLTFCVLAASPAKAHKVIASVFASGTLIEGEIGFSNGDMAGNTVVEVFDEAGVKLGEATTDADGFFTFQPMKRVVHVFKANLGAGHVAEVRMELEELPVIEGDSAQTISPASGAGDGVAPIPSKEMQTSQVSDLHSAGINVQALEENRELIREMIHREVTPLRREIAAYKEKNDFQTILGGVGYIFGLFGLFFYLSARRKLARG